MAERITDKLVRELEAPEAGNRIEYDTEVSGFGIRITAAGARSFVLNYRNAEGRERRLTIGAYGERGTGWSVEAARKRAADLRRQIDRGEDPLAEKIEKRDGTTVADLCDLYTEHHLPTKRPASQRDDKQMLKIVRAKLGRHKVDSDELGTEIARLHRSMKDTPYRANRVMALLSTMFNLGIAPWKVCKVNPTAGIKKYTEDKRSRYLDAKEIERLTAALNACEDKTAANVLRLCLLTGARVGEVCGAKWSQFNLDTALWVKPSSHTKQNKEHRAHLSAPAVALLKELRGDDEPASVYVFPSADPESPVPYKRVNEAWGAIRSAAKIPDVRIHDLRHTFASIVVSAGQSLPVVGALLGHTQAATTARYAHLFDEPLKAAVDTVGAIVTGKPAAKVTPIKAGAA